LELPPIAASTARMDSGLTVLTPLHAVNGGAVVALA
jgi:hypothetical protein